MYFHNTNDVIVLHPDNTVPHFYLEESGTLLSMSP